MLYGCFKIRENACLVSDLFLYFKSDLFLYYFIIRDTQTTLITFLYMNAKFL